MSKRKTPSEQQRVKFEGQEPTFYAMIPKMAIMDLTPYELALYCNYKQTASENGECTKSTATLATETHMSISKVKLTRKSLEGKGYIKVERHTDPSGIENQTMTVTIVNVWGKNHERYARQETTTPSHVVTPPQSQDDGEGVTTKPQRITIQEEPDKKDSAPPADAGSVSKVVEFPTPKKERKPDPLFDAVREHVFGIKDTNAQGGRIAKISNWLAGKYEGRAGQRVGYISKPAEPQHVKMFADYCQQSGITPPLDLVKFVENWRKWASSKRAHMTPAEVSARLFTLPEGVHGFGPDQFVRDVDTEAETDVA